MKRGNSSSTSPGSGKQGGTNREEWVPPKLSRASVQLGPALESVDDLQADAEDAVHMLDLSRLPSVINIAGPEETVASPVIEENYNSAPEEGRGPIATAPVPMSLTEENVATHNELNSNLYEPLSLAELSPIMDGILNHAVGRAAEHIPVSEEHNSDSEDWDNESDLAREAEISSLGSVTTSLSSSDDDDDFDEPPTRMPDIMGPVPSSSASNPGRHVDEPDA